MKLNEMLNVKLSYFDSAIPQMQRMLNSDKKKKFENKVVDLSTTGMRGLIGPIEGQVLSSSRPGPGSGWEMV